MIFKCGETMELSEEDIKLRDKNRANGDIDFWYQVGMVMRHNRTSHGVDTPINSDEIKCDKPTIKE